MVCDQSRVPFAETYKFITLFNFCVSRAFQLETKITFQKVANYTDRNNLQWITNAHDINAWGH